MNPLATWMADKDETDATLAKKLGISRVQVSRLRRGIYAASVETAKKLEAITEIPWPEFVERHTPACGCRNAPAGQA